MSTLRKAYNSQPLRVLHVVGAMNRGGAETWLLHALRTIDRERYAMDFVVHSAQPGDYDEEVRSLGGRLHLCEGASQPWRYVANFQRLLREYGPYDIVHAHQYLFNAFPLWAAQREKVPGRISHIYPLADVFRAQTPGRRLYRQVTTQILSRAANAVMCDSHSSLQAWEATANCRHQRRDVVFCGLDLEPFSRPVDRDAVRRELGLPLDKPLVVYVARFVPHKNHAQMLRVAERINQNGVRAHFVMAGSHGECLDDLTRQAHRRSDVSLLHNLPDISALLGAADIFFFPSLEEGFGLVAVEAAAAGLPVVATNLPTIQEACAAGHRALMFAPHDDEAAFNSLNALLNDAERRHRLGQEGRDWAQQFSIQRSVEALTGVYDDVCAPGARRLNSPEMLLQATKYPATVEVTE